MTKAPKARPGKIIDLILEFFNGTCTADRRAQVRTSLWNTIEDPAGIEALQRLSYSSQARIEARTVLDSLESVTNGMFNPEALESLEKLDANSIFYPWKLLIEALSAVYSRASDTEEHIARIPPGTPPAKLGKVLRRIAGLDTSTKLSPMEEAHCQKVLRGNNSIMEVLDNLAGCLESGNEDAFADGTALAVKDVLLVDSAVALRVAAWAFDRALDLDFSVAVLVKRLSMVLPASEVQRLLALALLPEDPDLSLLAWIRSLLCYVNNGDAANVGVQERLRLIGEVASLAAETTRASQSGGDHDYLLSLEALTARMMSEIGHALPDLALPEWSESCVFDNLASLPGTLVQTTLPSPFPALIQESKRRGAKMKPPKEMPAQFDLFDMN